MKKTLLILLIVVVVVAGLWAYSAYSNRNTAKAYCYVGCVAEDGFLTDIDDVGRVFVKYENAKQEIERYSTIYMQYDISELKETNGTYTEKVGIEEYVYSYSYVLESVKGIRYSIPSGGEPLYG